MMRELLKKFFVKKWAREIASEFTTTPQMLKGNLCGLGGQHYRPYHKSWVDIYEEWPFGYPNIVSIKVTTIVERTTFKEVIFFGYFGPLEAWCEKYLQGTYYLWPDDSGVRLILTDERDKVFWELKWGPNLPPSKTMSEGIKV